MYFHLPPLSGDQKCVYGVSCYRQIEAKVRHEAWQVGAWSDVGEVTAADGVRWACPLTSDHMVSLLRSSK